MPPWFKQNKHAISTKQGIVQNPVSRAPFSIKNEMLNYSLANLTILHNDPKQHVDQTRYSYCFFSSAFLG